MTDGTLEPTPPAPKSARELFEAYAAAVVMIETRSPAGQVGCGSAFHVGEGIFVTARHVVDGMRITDIVQTSGATLEASIELLAGPYYHPDPGVDVAALRTSATSLPVIPLGSHLDDWLDDEQFALRSILVMGYPPIPTSKRPVLVSAPGSVIAIVDRYNAQHPHFIVDAMSRGGFSGGVCLIEWNFALGLVTDSLLLNGKPSELGYMAVLTVEPILECLGHHKVVPKQLTEEWNDFWVTRSVDLGWKLNENTTKGAGSLDLVDDGQRLEVYASVHGVEGDIAQRELSARLVPPQFELSYTSHNWPRWSATERNGETIRRAISAIEEVVTLLCDRGLVRRDMDWPPPPPWDGQENA